MFVSVLLLGFAAVGLAVVATVQHRRLAEMRVRAEVLTTTVDQRAAELAVAADSSQRLERDLALFTEREALAAARTDAAEAARAAAEAQRALKPFLSGGPEIDPHVLWMMEQARSERTWRLSVAAGPDVESVFDAAHDPLETALRIEIDTAREEVGTEVTLEYGFSEAAGSTLSAAGALVVLRAAQELLAGVVRRSEAVSMRVRSEGSDVIVTVEAMDEFENPVEPTFLAIPESAHVEHVHRGVRVRHAFAVDRPAVDGQAEG